ncbi:MFS transporter [Sphaerisporangium rufum]|uniref:MFS transporter n=1 Tax=Sphaerisporangium rufum TaxID=1381558 RepID=A0A919V4K0_9ACTN|nr:MFS transporter [Sphaerisporangium rufum]GII81283.1 MFS transporter [Sphaerisporangium rufum]
MSDAQVADEGTSPWRNRNFRLFLSIQALSALGDSFSYVAIPLLVLRSTGSVVQMGLITGSVGVASIVAGVFAGYITDRVNRRALLIACDAARCLLYGLIAIVWVFSPQVWLLYLAVPLAGAFAMQFQVTHVTMVPSLVEQGQITRANGHLYASYAVAGVAGPMLAGLLSGAFGPSAALAVDAGTFAVSAAGVLLIRTRPLPAQPAAARARLGRDLLAGVGFLWRHRMLRSLTVLLALLTFITYGMTDLIVYYLKHDLGRPDGTVGYVLAAGTVGTLVASVTVDRTRGRLGFGVSWIGAWALCGVAIAGLGMSTAVPLIAAFTFGQLLCTGVAGICSMSFRQEVTPSHLLGRVTSAFWTLHSALGPLGAAVLAGAAAGHGVTPVLLVAGAACAVIALSATLTPIRPAGAAELAGESA